MWEGLGVVVPSGIGGNFGGGGSGDGNGSWLLAPNPCKPMRAFCLFTAMGCAIRGRLGCRCSDPNSSSTSSMELLFPDLGDVGFRSSGWAFLR